MKITKCNNMIHTLMTLLGNDALLKPNGGSIFLRYWQQHTSVNCSITDNFKRTDIKYELFMA